MPSLLTKPETAPVTVAFASTPLLNVPVSVPATSTSPVVVEFVTLLTTVPSMFRSLLLPMLVALSVRPVSTLTTPALVRTPTPLILPPAMSSVPVALLLMSPVTATDPAPTTLMSPSLLMVLVPDASVAVPDVPLKFMSPVTRLLISPASVTVPPVPTLMTAALFNVFAVPRRVALVPMLISPPVLLAIVPAASSDPSSSVMVEELVNAVTPLTVTPFATRITPVPELLSVSVRT